MEFRGCHLDAAATVAEVAQRQLVLLQQHLAYLEKNSPFYRHRFAQLGISAQQLISLDQLSSLPLTSKRDLADTNPDFLALSEEDVVDICTTSGTTGKPVMVWLNESDLQRLAENEKQAFTAAGVTRSDRVLIAAALDRGFMAGLAYFLGLRKIGACALRAGSGSLDYLTEMLRLQQPQVMVGVPSLLLALGRQLQQKQIDPTRLGVKKIICIGEPIRSDDLSMAPLGVALGDCWGAQIFGTYASTEIATAFADCEAGCGGHLLPELALVEIVDAQGNVVVAGEIGEVVVTPLQVQGTPLLRYRTGDLARLHTQPCACGRQTPRLGPILGRREQMLKCRGTTIFPAAIASVLHDLPSVEGYYLEVYRQHDLSDLVKVTVGCSDPQLSAATISTRIAARTRVKLDVEVCSPEQIVRKTQRSDRRKPITFFDYREAVSHQEAD